MNLNKFIALSKKEKYVCLMQGRGRQILRTHKAAYAADNLPKLTTDTIKALWNIKPEAQDKWQIVEARPEDYFLDKYPEEPVELCDYLISDGQETFIPIKTKSGLMGINKKRLAPIAHYDDLEFTERQVGNNTYIAVKKGFLTLAVIATAYIADERFYGVLKDFLLPLTEQRIEYERSENGEQENESK